LNTLTTLFSYRINLKIHVNSFSSSHEHPHELKSAVVEITGINLQVGGCPSKSNQVLADTEQATFPRAQIIKSVIYLTAAIKLTSVQEVKDCKSAIASEISMTGEWACTDCIALLAAASSSPLILSDQSY